MQKEIAVIGIDPAVKKKNAYAIARGEKIVSFGDLPIYTNELFSWFKVLKETNIGYLLFLVVEDQFSYKSWRELKDLAAERGRIEGIAAAAGIHVSIAINPHSWQTAIFRTKRPPKRSPGRDKLLIQYAEALLADIGADWPKMNIDHAAAIHIAMYQYRRLVIQEQSRGQ